MLFWLILLIRSSGQNSQAGVANDLKRYELIRNYVEHENSLINDRLTWLLLSQGLIFSAFGGLFIPISNLSVKIAEPCQSNDLWLKKSEFLAEIIDKISLFQEVLGLLGLFISFASLLGIWGAARSIKQIEKEYEKDDFFTTLLNSNYLPLITGGGSKLARWQGNISPQIIPIVLTFTWVIVLFVLSPSLFSHIEGWSIFIGKSLVKFLIDTYKCQS